MLRFRFDRRINGDAIYNVAYFVPGSFSKLLSPLFGMAILATKNHLALVERSKE